MCGQFDVHTKWKSHSATHPLTDVAGSGPLLLGGNSLNSCMFSFKPNQIYFQCYGKDELGTIKGISAKLEVEQGPCPKFFRARTVPYALQPAVGEEYNRLECDGIITKVEFSKWAIPLVHVLKSDGSTLSCGNYAFTDNPQLYNPYYLIPLPEDVFNNPRGR